MALPRVNAVIVGSGPGGGTVAKELATAGLSVVLLERGRWNTFAEHRHDELWSQRTSVLGCPFGPDNRRYRRVVKQGDTWRVVLPTEDYKNNAACVGGGSFSYGAMAWRYMPESFRMKSTYGHVEGSSLEDWPISYDDLEPYYERAEDEIGVSGDYSPNPLAPPRNKPLPMPPLSYTREGRLLEPAARRLGWHPFPIAMFRNSVSYRGRPACARVKFCVGFACALNARGGAHNTVIPVALATGNCELRTECVAAKILVNDRGIATGVAYYDPDGRYREQPADLVVVSGSATESPRLLLNSNHRLWPNGLCNNNDWVGRNLQAHAYTGAFGLFEEETYDDIGPGADLAVADFCHHNPGLTGGGLLCNEFIRLPYLFTGVRPPGAPRWGLGHKRFQRDWYRRCVRVVGPVEEMPNFESRVAVDPVVKDYWGIPVARISGARHPNDRIVATYMADKAVTWLREAGAVETWTTIPGLGVSGGQHQAGTCRMGDDPHTSVVNRYCQSHEIDNLFVVDGSVHVTNGTFNPALTIFAVAYWASDYIKRQWTGGAFRAGRG
jgi:choline dehydrogenase-like flavoprotein